MSVILEFPLKRQAIPLNQVQIKTFDNVLPLKKAALTLTDLKFIENEKKLSKNFTYDLISHQMHLLARCAKSFTIPPSDQINSKAHLLLKHLLHYSGTESALQFTLLYYQIRELITDYLAEAQFI